jgi:hypothetical protein
MATWQYKIKSGVALREAIDNEDMEQVVKCLLLCYRELLNKLNGVDKWYHETDIHDSIGVLMAYELCPDDDEDFINDALAEFYDLCDELGAWICTINEEV